LTDIIKYGFVAGEVAESYYGRADLEKYDLALAEAENWYVDYHGGLSNVQGTKLVDWIPNADLGFRLFPFKFSDTLANKYMVLVGSTYIAFIQDGSFVLEPAKTVTAISGGSAAVLTVPGHGFSSGQLISVITPGSTVEMVAQTYQITVLTADTFRLINMFGGNVNYSAFTPYTGGMTIARAYAIWHPYPTSALPNLKMQQVRDVLRITHPDYPVMNLKRISHTNWTLTAENFHKTMGRPSKPWMSVSNAGEYSMGFIITAVDADGNESLPSDMGTVSGASDIEEVRDSAVTASWGAVSRADYYNVYRTRVSHAGVSRSFQVGYVGRARGTRFTDTGITPDFTKTPPRNYNPFAKNAIKYINIINDGAGVPASATMSISDPTGSGFIGYPIVESGNVVGFNILDGGENYTSPVITLSGGSGYVFSIERTPAADTDPATSVVYQQRQVYAGSRSNPLTINGSRPGMLSDFSVSEIVLASDAFSHEIDSENFSPMRHLIAARGGIICMSSGGIWLMSGSQSGAITATDVQADNNVFTGAADVTPLKIDTDILYISNTGGRVNSLAYNDQYKLYSPIDVSILSNHLVAEYRIKRWAYADEPHRMVYGVREDGTMLLFTMIKDQEIYGWTRRVTKGYYKDVLAFDGDGDSEVYYAVRRFVDGQWLTFIERLVTAKPKTVEDAVYLDCALSLDPYYPAADMSMSSYKGDGVQVFLNASLFTTDHVGQIIRYGKGKARIVSVEGPYNATANVINEFDQLMNYSETLRMASAGEWTLDKEYKVVNGLHHLEGELVTALADGNVIRDLVVTNGAVTLPYYASRVVVGIPYKSIAKNLPATVSGAVIENKRKRATSLAIRVLDTRGLKVGARKDELYQVRTQMAETLGEASPLYTGLVHTTIEPVWSEDAQNYFVQEYPLPATILGYIMETDVGDG